ncbi:outer membrane protein assembly factor BamD [candidate division WOR-3 bacterium]|nr:outer membrane protein assembly factor BamD [candidate division WOR-3 bacterium]
MNTAVARAGLLLAVLLVAAGCPNRVTLERKDNAADALGYALGLLEQEQYQPAEEALTYVIFNFPGSRQASDAQYHLAESHYRRRDYEQARTEYEFYLKSFPNGRYQEEATFRLGLSWLNSAPAGPRDKSGLKTARETLRDFLALYPDSELVPEVNAALDRIERRFTDEEFAVARLYYKAGEYRAALVYYEYVAARFEPDRWEPADRLAHAVCLYESDRVDDARERFRSLVESDCPEPVRAGAREYLGRIAGP